MKVLFVAPKPPCPDGTPDQIRTYRFMRMLAQKGHQVDLATFVGNSAEKESIKAVRQHCSEVRTVFNPFWWASIKAALGVLSWTPFQVLYHTSVRMHFLLRQMQKASNYDIVHMATARMMEFWPCFQDVPLVVDHIHAMSYAMQQHDLHRTDPVFSTFLMWEKSKVEHYQKQIENRHTYAIASEDGDVAALGYRRFKVLPFHPAAVNPSRNLNSQDALRELEDAYRRATRLFTAWQLEKKQQCLPLALYHEDKIEPLDSGESHSFDTSFNRIFDICISLTGLILALPLMIITSIALLIQDGRPLIFSQIRVGKNGRNFRIYKFRTMIKNAEKKSGAVFATKNDSRVTRLGRFLRITRIDEIPQLVNILAGDMSLIGPRPERPEFVTDFAESIPFYERRLDVKPGLTGWAQIKFPYASSIEDTRRKLEYDLFYIKNRSLLMTLAILFQTVAVVLTGRGAR